MNMHEGDPSTGVFHTVVPCCPRVTLRLGKIQLPRSSEDTPSKQPTGVSPSRFWVWLLLTKNAYSYSAKDSFM